MYPTLFITPGVKDFAQAVDAERQRQLEQWGDQRHPDLGGDCELQCDRREMFAERAEYYRTYNGSRSDWSGILLKEVYEALAEADPAKIRAELVQVAAVCAAWVTDIDSREA